VIAWLTLLLRLLTSRHWRHPATTHANRSNKPAPSNTPSAAAPSSSAPSLRTTDLHAGVGHHPALNSDHTYHTWT
jgi:hypothetical protein